jgi:preprotein translocase subunit SecA
MIFTTTNQKEIKYYAKRVKKINALEEKFQLLNDEDLKLYFQTLKIKVQSNEKTLNDVLEESFAITRECAIRTLNMRHYDVQMIGGMVLHDGKISEMKTGEGKTLVATLPVVLNSLVGKGVHLVTVNDYLANRDASDLMPLYNFLDMKVGVISEGMYDEKLKKEQYDADVTYGTNNEFGFDYLRDNMKYSLEEMVQRNHSFVIVDEVDSILIDEARTPLIISGPTNKTLDNYVSSNEVALKLKKGEEKEAKLGEDKETTGDFIVDEKNKVILLTEDGIRNAEKLYGIGNLYDLANAHLSHHLDQALKSNYLFEKDVDYVVNDGEVQIVDEFTGRISEGRRFSDGLHQALEAKENVDIKEESQTLADITFQNYFRMYDKLAGMTGTAQTEATEFAEIYNLDVVSIPTNVPVVRKDLNDLIYKSELEKFQAVTNAVKKLSKEGRPTLIGTASIEKSEALHYFLKKEKIAHTVLNAKQHAQEGEIIKNAGKKGAVTIATNMAGRGVDIKLDQEIKDLGGLAIIGTERHENRRIDNQLRGRAGRQGDSGSSQFFLSLEDNLLRIFGSDKIKGMMERLGVEDGDYIESKMVTNAVEKAQKKVEKLHFEGRKQIVEYDDIANEQRKIVYKFRNQLLSKEYDIDQKILDIRSDYLTHILNEYGAFDGVPYEDYDIKALLLRIREDLNLIIDEKNIKEEHFNDFYEAIYKTLTNEYNEKMSVVDPDVKKDIEKELYLKTLDNAYREHLYQMDTVKTGIRLRAYNQKDPLVEYKKESFHLFEELVQTIKYETIKTLHVVQFRSEAQEAEEEAFAKLREQNEAMNNNLSYSNQEVKIEKKIARNEPCPCGSGKKYKQCCGKSGPKKGILAK